MSNAAVTASSAPPAMKRRHVAAAAIGQATLMAMPESAPVRQTFPERYRLKPI